MDALPRFHHHETTNKRLIEVATNLGDMVTTILAMGNLILADDFWSHATLGWSSVKISHVLSFFRLYQILHFKHSLACRPFHAFDSLRPICAAALSSGNISQGPQGNFGISTQTVVSVYLLFLFQLHGVWKVASITAVPPRSLATRRRLWMADEGWLQ